jgi:hypothetical protein
MRREKKVLVFLLLCSALVMTAVFVVGGRPASGQKSAGEATESILRINSKAAVLNSADETQIRELADEIFKTFDLDQVPAEVVDSLKDRLVQAEVNYRSGRGNPVSEFGVVRMTNMLADTLGAPAYAKTNVFEVRRLEMNFLPYLSKFIGKRPAGEVKRPKALKSSINPIMSPLEAFTIAGLVIQQKRFNPEYQVTNSEWVAKQSAKRQKKAGDSANDIGKDRSDEFEQAVQRGAAGLSAAQWLKLPNQALDRLGVARTDGRNGQ